MDWDINLMGIPSSSKETNMHAPEDYVEADLRLCEMGPPPLHHDAAEGKCRWYRTSKDTKFIQQGQYEIL